MSPADHEPLDATIANLTWWNWPPNRKRAGKRSFEEAKSLSHTEQMRIEPQFLSSSFGTPHYFQLTDDCAVEVSAGASDQSEMGVYHDLFRPQRLSNLRQRLSDYTPAGTNVGVIFVT